MSRMQSAYIDERRKCRSGNRLHVIKLEFQILKCYEIRGTIYLLCYKVSFVKHKKLSDPKYW